MICSVFVGASARVHVLRPAPVCGGVCPSVGELIWFRDVDEMSTVSIVCDSVVGVASACRFSPGLCGVFQPQRLCQSIPSAVVLT